MIYVVIIKIFPENLDVKIFGELCVFIFRLRAKHAIINY